MHLCWVYVDGSTPLYTLSSILLDFFLLIIIIFNFSQNKIFIKIFTFVLIEGYWFYRKRQNKLFKTICSFNIILTILHTSSVCEIFLINRVIAPVTTKSRETRVICNLPISWYDTLKFKVDRLLTLKHYA